MNKIKREIIFCSLSFLSGYISDDRNRPVEAELLVLNNKSHNCLLLCCWLFRSVPPAFSLTKKDISIFMSKL